MQVGGPAATGCAVVVVAGRGDRDAAGPDGVVLAETGVGEAEAGGWATWLVLGRAGPAGLPPAAGCPPVQAVTNTAASPAAASAAVTARERATDIGVTFSAGARLRGRSACVAGLPGAGPYLL